MDYPLSDVAFLISYGFAAIFMVEAWIEFCCSLTSFGSEGGCADETFLILSTGGPFLM